MSRAERPSRDTGRHQFQMLRLRVSSNPAAAQRALQLVVPVVQAWVGFEQSRSYFNVLTVVPCLDSHGISYH